MLRDSNSARAILLRVLLLAAVCLAMPVQARAHNGPPFPIVESKRVGPVIISLWTHPDLGRGTFFVIVDPAPGQDLRTAVLHR
jgi:hypothetical protein